MQNLWPHPVFGGRLPTRSPNAHTKEKTHEITSQKILRRKCECQEEKKHGQETWEENRKEEVAQPKIAEVGSSPGRTGRTGVVRLVRGGVHRTFRSPAFRR